ncbi:NAD-dependent epimerase/dehydratase family protein [Priestia megaterium]|nr:NAD-dependent epimerase/dehydratase family protein [Priestia megaterium]
MRVLVTGGAGFIGSHVVELLINQGYTPIVLDDLSNGDINHIPNGVKFYNVQLLSEKIEQIFKTEKPDAVIHLAAQINVAKSIKDPVEDAATNILGTINLLNCCKLFTTKKFIFSSSSAVYGESDKPISEDAPTNPISFYGTSKLVSEIYIKLFNHLYGIPYTILRYANVFGPRQKSDGEGGVVSIFINQLLNAQTPCIYGDGKQTRDFVFVEDVAQANVSAIKHGKNETFNIGYNKQTSINDLYKIISEKINSTISPVYKNPLNGNILYSQLDNHKAIEKLKWQPVSDVESGLEKTILYFKQQQIKKKD